MKKHIPDEIMRKFDALENRLSPENLCCDGEISGAQVKRRRAQIMREWRELEKKAGCKVTSEDVYNWYSHRVAI